MLNNIAKTILEQVAGLHDIPAGAVSLRVNGKSEVLKSSANIEIERKSDNPGINVYIHSSCKGEACHIPVVVDQNNLFDMVYNDFYIEDGAIVTIVAGCGVHSNGTAGHDGKHTFHVGKNATVTYIENHLGLGKSEHKILNPTTILKIGKNSVVTLNTTQIGGVDSANRTTKAILADNATLIINEKILTDRFETAKTNFSVQLKGKNSKCNIVSRSVARGESEQVFKSNMIGKNLCFGHVECDGIVLDKSKISSLPQVSAFDAKASLSHEAAIGKIATDQIVKLRTLGLTEKQAEEKIIEGFLK